MVTYVLVHGAGHGGWCFGPLAEVLRNRGHRVHAPTLTGCGDRSHLLRADVGLETHIVDITSFLEFEDLQDVVLAGHSYGALVIMGVADRIRDRIRHLVFLDGATPLNGQSLNDWAGPAVSQAIRTVGRTIDGVELVLLPDTNPLDIPGLHGVTDPQAIAWMLPRLRPHPWRCLEENYSFITPKPLKPSHRPTSSAELIADPTIRYSRRPSDMDDCGPSIPVTTS